jgi:glutamine amidotransferase
MQVVIVDTGYGNLRSVERATQAAAQRVAQKLSLARTRDAEQIRAADAVIFPGQGAFRDCRLALTDALQQALLEKLRSGAPFLGICIGLQLLFDGSAEAPECGGLAWFHGQVARLDGQGVKIPHMGWNQLEIHQGGHKALSAAGGEGTWVYFVHSYHAVPTDDTIVKATVSYGNNRVTAAVARDNVLATQFHPEKSQEAGLALLAEFLRG